MNSDAVKGKNRKKLIGYTDFSSVPYNKAETLAKVSVAIDDMMREYHLDCITLRCSVNADRSRRCALCIAQ